MKWPSAPTLMMGAVAGIGVFALVRIAKAKGNAPQTTAANPTFNDGSPINVGTPVMFPIDSATQARLLAAQAAQPKTAPNGFVLIPTSIPSTLGGSVLSIIDSQNVTVGLDGPSARLIGALTKDVPTSILLHSH